MLIKLISSLDTFVMTWLKFLPDKVVMDQLNTIAGRIWYGVKVIRGVSQVSL